MAYLRLALVFKVANQFPYQLSVKYARQLKFLLMLGKVKTQSGKWSCRHHPIQKVQVSNE